MDQYSHNQKFMVAKFSSDSFQIWLICGTAQVWNMGETGSGISSNRAFGERCFRVHLVSCKTWYSTKYLG